MAIEVREIEQEWLNYIALIFFKHFICILPPKKQFLTTTAPSSNG